MTYLGVAAAALLLACAPTVAEETPEAPDATVAEEAAPAVEETAAESEAPAMAAAGAPMVCKRGKTERHVNVVAPGSEGRVCEMHYAKPTEGVENRVLWYATSDKGFCEEKANALMASLISSGWSCTNPDGTPVSVEAAAPVEEAAPEAPAEPEAPVEPEAPAEPEEPAEPN
jgi:hypothetical protein